MHKPLNLSEKITTILVHMQLTFGAKTLEVEKGLSGRPDYYRAREVGLNFFQTSGFYRDRQNNSGSNAQSGANLRLTQD